MKILRIYLLLLLGTFWVILLLSGEEGYAKDNPEIQSPCWNMPNHGLVHQIQQGLISWKAEGMRNLVKKKCPVCKKDFRTRHKKQIFCSRYCKGTKYEREIKTCLVCGKIFSNKDILSQKYFRIQKYCSKKCFGLSKRKEITNKICPVCKGMFQKRVTSKAVCCSKRCAYNYARIKNGNYKTIEEMKKNLFSFGRFTSNYRVVMEQKLGRKLLPGEIVHHIDCNHENNDPQNLVLLGNVGIHTKVHHSLNLIVEELLKRKVIYYYGEEYKIRKLHLRKKHEILTQTKIMEDQWKIK